MDLYETFDDLLSDGEDEEAAVEVGVGAAEAAASSIAKTVLLSRWGGRRVGSRRNLNRGACRWF